MASQRKLGSPGSAAQVSATRSKVNQSARNESKVVGGAPMLGTLKNQLNRFRPEIIIIATTHLYIAIGGFMQSVLNNPAEEMIRFIVDSLNRRGVEVTKTMSSWLWSTMVVMFAAGSFVGSLFSHKMADRFGRKPALMYFASAIYLVSAMLFYIARPLRLFEFLVIARFFTGVSNGLANPVLATYLVEAVPEDRAGFAGSMLDFSACIGSFLAIKLSEEQVLGGDLHWHHLLGGPCVIVGLLQILSAVILHESPKYLLLNDQKRTEAAKAVKFFYGSRVNEDECWRVVQSFQDAENHETTKEGQAEINAQSGVQVSVYRKHFKTLALSACLGCLPLVCGYTLILSYSTEILIMSGSSEARAQTHTSVLAIFEIVGGISSLITNFRSPRRLVLLCCSVVCLLFMTVIAILLALHHFHPSPLLLDFIGSNMSLVVGCTVLGPFPLYLLLPAEFASQNVRALATSITTSVYYLICILSLLLFYPMFETMGALTFIPFIVIGVILLPLIYKYLPETAPSFKVQKG